MISSMYCMLLLVRFVRRNPNGAQSMKQMVHWPAYDTDKQQYLRIGEHFSFKRLFLAVV